jgi:hypothetical protein
MISFSLNLLPFAGIAFLWFIAVVRDRLGQREDRFFGTVFLGSGLLFVAMMFNAAAAAGGIIRVLGSGSENLIQGGTYALGRVEIQQTMHIYSDEDGRSVHDHYLHDLPTNPAGLPTLDGVPRLRARTYTPAKHGHR